jgi:hypothetical protein
VQPLGEHKNGGLKVDKHVPIRPEHMPIVKAYMEKLTTVHIPKIDAAENKAEWKLAFKGYHDEGSRFWNLIRIFYPETKGMACGLMMDEDKPDWFQIVIQGSMKNMEKKLSEGLIPDEVLSSLTAQKLTQGFKKNFDGGVEPWLRGMM